MRLTSFRFAEDPDLDDDGNPTPTRFGALVSDDSEICDLTASLPTQWGHVDALTFLSNGDDSFRRADEAIKSGHNRFALESVKLLAPVVFPGQVINVADNYHRYVPEEGEEKDGEEDDGEEEDGTEDGEEEEDNGHTGPASASQSPISQHSQSPVSQETKGPASELHSPGGQSSIDAADGSEKDEKKKMHRNKSSGGTSPRSDSSEQSDTTPRPGGPVALPEEPVPQFFTKYISATFGRDSYTPKKDESAFTVGGELAVIMGRQCRRLREDEAMDYIGGFCIAHDFAELDWTDTETRWLHGKAYDAPLLLGPVMVSHRSLQEPQNLSIRTFVNGQEVQRGNTKFMKFDIGQLLQHVTRFMPLYPGDVVLTGRPPCHPSAPQSLAVGDRVTVQVGDIGEVSCYVAVEHDIDD